MKVNKKVQTKIGFVILGILIVGFIVYSLKSSSNVTKSNKPQKSTSLTPTVPLEGISSVWYINLDRSPERKERIEKEVQKLGQVPVHRWKAVDGYLFTEYDYDKYNIPYWSRPSFAKEEKKRKGELGCIFSHKTLLEHLNTLPKSQTTNYLILEDDVDIDDDFVMTWNRIQKEIDPNWDMIFVGLGSKVNQVQNGIGKPEKITGTFGYVVKSTSISAIIESIETICDPIDELYSRIQNKFTVYGFSPSKIHQADVRSTIRN